ncbi:hypothetical protein ABIB40_001072 [Pedobacter sp. UYP30]|uniref:hypothetical protein n=1 Tax=Pedobacter sp. UYP30 TaxID=1756400 RepID=UPI0033936219
MIAFGYYTGSDSDKGHPSYQASTDSNNIISPRDIDGAKDEVVKSSEPKRMNNDKLKGKKFTFKSTSYDKELNGVTIEARDEVSYHQFDFVNMIVTQKPLYDGEWVEFSYPIVSSYKEKGIAATTYVLIIGSMGVKEIWFSPDVPNLGYDYIDGSTIACYGISKQ